MRQNLKFLIKSIVNNKKYLILFNNNVLFTKNIRNLTKKLINIIKNFNKFYYL